MITHIFTGFDSAWTDSSKTPGAIASIISHDNGKNEFLWPELATFHEAKDKVLKLKDKTPYHLLAIDQPLIVPNLTSLRPAERVAASLVSKLKGGVQPANRSKESMFGDDAPIWKFLENIPHVQNPWEAYCSDGYYAIEVFPALSLPGLFPHFFERGQNPKYNPVVKNKFTLEDWKLVVGGLKGYGEEKDIPDLVEWASTFMSFPTEEIKKWTQDMVDAVICAVIAHHWRMEYLDSNMVIGDNSNGYMVTATNPLLEDILYTAAEKNNVPINENWEGGAKPFVRQDGSTHKKVAKKNKGSLPSKIENEQNDGENSISEAKPLSSWTQEEMDACCEPSLKKTENKAVDIKSLGKISGKALGGIGLIIGALVYMLRGGDR